MMLKCLVLLLVAMPTWAGSIYKCTQPDGSVTFSNIACPEDTVDREHKGRTGQAFQQNEDAYNPYSLTEQARRIDERNQMERMEHEMRRRVQEPQQQYIPSTSRQPRMSYEAALQIGLKECGYRVYGRLTKSQKRCVHEEMAKIDHAPEQSTILKAIASGEGLIHPYTGELLELSEGEFIGTRDGTIYEIEDNEGLRNTRTGEYIRIY